MNSKNTDKPKKVSKTKPDKKFNKSFGVTEIIESNSVPLDAIAPENLTNKQLINKIEQLVKTETSKQIASQLKELTPFDMNIAREIAQGYTEKEIMSKHTIDSKKIEELKANASFVQEVLRLTSEIGMGNGTTRIQMLARLGGEIFDSFIEDPQQIKDIAPKDRLKLLLEINQTLDKAQGVDKEGSKTNVDITVILKQKNIEMQRLKVDSNSGIQYLESPYPVINAETGEIEGENLEQYLVTE